MTDPRTLVVHVLSSEIGDGEIAPPRVGEVLTGPLRFVELPDTAGDVVRVQAHLEPWDQPPILQTTGRDSPRRWEWNGLLRGDGWTASWRGFRPRTGYVELTGRFYGVFGYDTDGRFRGRVTRARIVSERYRFVSGKGWDIVPGHRTAREVRDVPQFFGHEPMPHETDVHVDQDTSVMVDLDLDDVPPLPTRPSIVPGGVAADGGVTWVVDAELPLLVGIDAQGGVAEHVLPGKIVGGRSIWATAAGCWIGGEDGLFWAAVDREPERIDSLPAHTGAAHGGRLLVCTGDGAWRMYAPGSDPVEVQGPTGHVNSIAVHHGNWIAAVHSFRDKSVRLVRVSSTGESTIGPAVPQLSRAHEMPYLAGDPLRLIRGLNIAVVEPDLTVRDDGEQLGRNQFHGGQVGDLAWTIGHPPGRNSTSASWPFPGPVSYDEAEQFWLFTVHDAATLQPLTSVPVIATSPDVALDAAGRILVIARGVRALRHDDPVMQWPVEVNVAELLDGMRRQQSCDAEGR